MSEAVGGYGTSPIPLADALRGCVGLRSTDGMYPQFVPTAAMLLDAANLLTSLYVALDQAVRFDALSEQTERWAKAALEEASNLPEREN